METQITKNITKTTLYDELKNLGYEVVCGSPASALTMAVIHKDLIIHMCVSNNGQYLCVGDNMSSRYNRHSTKHKQINAVKKAVANRIDWYEFYKSLNTANLVSKNSCDPFAQKPFDLFSIGV